MLKHITITVTAALVAGSLSLLAPPANAVTIVEVYADDVTVKGDDCNDSDIDISGDWVDADVTVSLTDPNGVEIANDTFPDTTGQLLLYVSMCGSDPAGTYTVAATVYDYNDATEIDGSTTFTLTKVKAPPKAKTKIKTAKKYRPGKRFPWVVGGKLLRSGKAYSHQRVLLVAKIQGDWYKIDSAKTRKGIVAWEFKPNNTRWRFYFPGNGKTKPSVSALFRTPHRGHGRVMNDSAAGSLVHRVRRPGHAITVPTLVQDGILTGVGPKVLQRR